MSNNNKSLSYKYALVCTAIFITRYYNYFKNFFSINLCYLKRIVIALLKLQEIWERCVKRESIRVKERNTGCISLRNFSTRATQTNSFRVASRVSGRGWRSVTLHNILRLCTRPSSVLFLSIQHKEHACGRAATIICQSVRSTLHYAN